MRRGGVHRGGDGASAPSRGAAAVRARDSSTTPVARWRQRSIAVSCARVADAETANAWWRPSRVATRATTSRSTSRVVFDANADSNAPAAPVSAHNTHSAVSSRRPCGSLGRIARDAKYDARCVLAARQSVFASDSETFPSPNRVFVRDATIPSATTVSTCVEGGAWTPHRRRTGTPRRCSDRTAPPNAVASASSRLSKYGRSSAGSTAAESEKYLAAAAKSNDETARKPAVARATSGRRRDARSDANASPSPAFSSSSKTRVASACGSASANATASAHAPSRKRRTTCSSTVAARRTSTNPPRATTSVLAPGGEFDPESDGPRGAPAANVRGDGDGGPRCSRGSRTSP